MGKRISARARAFVERKINSRPADFVIGGDADPYLLRWWLIPRNRWFNIYAHLILRDDDDRALHDHPWVNASVILSGGYTEVTAGHDGAARHAYAPGAIKLRRPKSAHRLELNRDGEQRPIPALTLFITGPRVREWGFLCPQGWRHWKEFTRPDDTGLVGRGCGE